MKNLHYNILKPKSEAANPPLLLMLHGYGSDENDLFSFADLLNDRFLVISARAPRNLSWGGYAWYDIDFTSNQSRFGNPEQAEESMEMILQLILEIQEKYQTVISNTVLLGFSQGAILSYGLSLNHPEKFKNILALSGYIFNDIMPKTINSSEVAHLDFFQSHGTIDEVIPIDWARKSSEWLKSHGLKHQYTEYPMGHGINQDCFNDMIKWIAARYPIL